ncbi:hypothetical protein J2Z80_000563 [Thermoanaerobacterium butyriciformans]|uniref:Uncharacterized protein n=1 Tax=Thermoanaerobacterium butyriciformans TaxID=1702242 RepID=A0ABS4NDH2_9THEO|nr:hypothetical protein [Thermoanaerobacterium butyriciformans]
MPLGVDDDYILSGDGKESIERVAYELIYFCCTRR